VEAIGFLGNGLRGGLQLLVDLRCLTGGYFMVGIALEKTSQLHTDGFQFVPECFGLFSFKFSVFLV
jgi:hypothetical protein